MAWTCNAVTVVADGSEQTVIDSTANGVYDINIDTTAMQIGDIVTIRAYKKVKVGGAYIRLYKLPLNDVQDDPLWHSVVASCGLGVKITLQQTAGVNRNYDCNVEIQ